MADTYEYLGAVETSELVGSSMVRPAREVTARAVPSGYVFSTIVAPADFNANNLGLILAGIAAAVNKAAKVPGVVDLNVYSDVTGGGQFTRKLSVGVESTTGNSSETIDVPYGALFDARFAAAVKKARDNMDEIEAL